MKLTKLAISHLRNISSLSFEPEPGINIIEGNNGSGKTSLLEAIYLLNVAKSFRSNQIQPIIQHGKLSSVVYGELLDGTSIGIQKEKNKTTIRVNKQHCSYASKLAAIAPMCVIYQDIFSLIDSGPGLRRQFLDWGLFHVEPSFLFHWKQYQHCLKQRNKALRQKQNKNEINAWYEVLVQTGQELDRFRKQYLQTLEKFFFKICRLFELPNLKLAYQQGWANDLSYGEALTRTFDIDFKQGFTSVGPHRADLKLNSEQYQIKNELSRGQQKLFLFALKFSQAAMLERQVIYLVDDLAAELDGYARERVINYLIEQDSQVFVTSLEASVLEPLANNSKTYSICQGSLIP